MKKGIVQLILFFRCDIQNKNSDNVNDTVVHDVIVAGNEMPKLLVCVRICSGMKYKKIENRV